MKVGDQVTLSSNASKDQDNWGNCSNHALLQEGKKYEVEYVEIHSWHTKIKLKGIEGRFNSVIFNEE